MVQKLIEEGAIVIGKANMAEFAESGMNTNSSVLGQTLNSY